MTADEETQTIKSIDALAKQISIWASDKGFWAFGADNPRSIKTVKAMLVVTEMAELVEGIRAGINAVSSLDGFTYEEEEIADAIIRLLDYSGHYNLRIGDAILAKMAKNLQRPFRHGKKF